MPRVREGKKKEVQPVTRDYTINLHKRLHGIQFKKRAPRAIREIRKFAVAEMFTKDVRVDTSLNRFLWSQGIRNVPRKVRVRISRKKNEDEDAKEKFYSLVQHLQVDSFEGLKTEKA
ncbi:UNKNOWN [Stylonychia lemnae]|uniref:60s ribosomal protein l31 n=1 Tax=Stylonychia lemnae TaxID=5949 RepID=A0A078ALR3_STYLE|nr:UNKNOWN [Stylonychia lemnae]|eukprot:CDW83169.1 UNKNOWN [Stylonychia lemnae]